MDKEFQTDQQLIAAIIANNPRAWSHLIDQYQGRLLNYARTRVRQTSDAEDAVQETFISLLNTLQKHPNKIIENLETYLFVILRNHIYSQYRTRWSKSVCLIEDVVCSNEHGEHPDIAGQIASPDPSVTSILRQKEQTDLDREMLAKKLKVVIAKSKKSLDFQNLKLLDLLFYSQLGNHHAALLLNLKESSVRTFKHRFIKRLCEDLSKSQKGPVSFETLQDSLLSEIWEQHRLTCPKYSTLGNFLLENLEPGWFDYIDFHLTTFGCHFCRANFKDLQQQQKNEQHTAFQDRLIASTIGFFSKAQNN